MAGVGVEVHPAGRSERCGVRSTARLFASVLRGLKMPADGGEGRPRASTLAPVRVAMVVKEFYVPVCRGWGCWKNAKSTPKGSASSPRTHERLKLL